MATGRVKIDPNTGEVVIDPQTGEAVMDTSAPTIPKVTGEPSDPPVSPEHFKGRYGLQVEGGKFGMRPAPGGDPVSTETLTGTAGGVLAPMLLSAATRNPSFLLASGALGGAGGTQAGRMMEGKDPSLKGFAAETALNLLIPIGARKIAQGMKNIPARIAQTVFKGKKPLKHDEALELLEKYGRKKGLKATYGALEDDISRIGSKMDEMFSERLKGSKVNITGAISQAKKSINNMAKRGDIDPEVAERAVSNMERKRRALIDAGTINEAGWTDLKTAQKFKKNTLDEMSKWEKLPPAARPAEATPDILGGREGRRSLRKQMSEIEKRQAQKAGEKPMMEEVMEEYSKAAKFRPYIQKAMETEIRNRPQSMQDIFALTGFLQSAARPESGAAKYLPALAYSLSRAQKSPGLAKALLQGSKGVPESPGALIPFQRMMGLMFQEDNK